ncbi:T-cell-interacting, activating receptor on myeloid cells protein 1-like [Pelodiscus sinensis]|uniref:T-cell-interacting, activating receptor on myeloid cells protein 1-like n=1 Tax=Pelodiscus sinensis TaxID=13735 RepID=UPI003F6AC079
MLETALKGPSLLCHDISSHTPLPQGCWLAGHRGVWAEPSDPKPSISLRPSEGVSLGRDVTIWCQGLRQDRRFVLKREGGYFLHEDPDGLGAEFLLSSLHREQGGSYSCFYHSKSEPFTVSYPSDPVELVLRDPSLPRPSISLSPTGVTTLGANVTIRCQGPRQDVRFFLHQAGDLNRPRPMEPAGDGAEFHIHPVGRQHGGSYSCSYRPQSEPFISSQPSDPVELVVAETSFPKPSISLHPSRRVTLGAATTVRCQGSYWHAQYRLYKDGNPTAMGFAEPAGHVAEFPFPSVSQADAGSYHCHFRPTWSHPSDPVELVVADCGILPATVPSHAEVPFPSENLQTPMPTLPQ